MGYPTVSIEQTRMFARAWDKKGLKMLLDEISVEFARDWANIALKSYVDDMIAIAKTKAAAKVKPNAVPEASPEPPKSSIILTDK